MLISVENRFTSPILELEARLHDASTNVTFFGSEEVTLSDGKDGTVTITMHELTREFVKCWKKVVVLKKEDHDTGLRVIKTIDELFKQTTQILNRSNCFTLLLNAIRRHFTISPKTWKYTAEMFTVTQLKTLMRLNQPIDPLWQVSGKVIIFDPQNILKLTLSDLVDIPFSLRNFAALLSPATVIPVSSFWGKRCISCEQKWNAQGMVYKYWGEADFEALVKALEGLWLSTPNLKRDDLKYGQLIIKRISQLFDQSARLMATRNCFTRFIDRKRNKYRYSQTNWTQEVGLWKSRFSHKVIESEQKECEEKAIVSWTQLPPDIITDLGMYFNHVDSRRFRGVCKLFNKMANDCNFWHLPNEYKQRMDRCFIPLLQGENRHQICRIKQCYSNLCLGKEIPVTLSNHRNSYNKLVVNQKIVTTIRQGLGGTFKTLIFDPLTGQRKEIDHVGLMFEDCSDLSLFWLFNSSVRNKSLSLCDSKTGACLFELKKPHVNRMFLQDEIGSRLIICSVSEIAEGIASEHVEVVDIADKRQTTLGKFSQERVAGEGVLGSATRKYYLTHNEREIKCYSLPHNAGNDPIFSFQHKEDEEVGSCKLINDTRFVYDLLKFDPADRDDETAWEYNIYLYQFDEELQKWRQLQSYPSYWLVNFKTSFGSALSSMRNKSSSIVAAKSTQLLIINAVDGKEVVIKNPSIDNPNWQLKTYTVRPHQERDSNFDLFGNRLVLFRRSDLPNMGYRASDHIWIYDVNTGNEIAHFDIGHCFVDDGHRVYDPSTGILMLRQVRDTSLIFINLDEGKIIGESYFKDSATFFADHKQSWREPDIEFQSGHLFSRSLDVQHDFGDPAPPRILLPISN